jgi:drug/metabolite transporter (DMT)-like permease
MVLASAVCFGTLAIFAKLAYRTGLGLEQVLAFRFLLAAPAMWIVALAARQNPLRLGWRTLVVLFAMGALGYAGQAFSFFSALKTLPASVAELVLYTYPAMVAFAAWVFLGQRLSALHLFAIPLSFAGVALLVGGASFGLTPALAYAFAAPVIYSCYIIVGDQVMRSAPPLAASAVAITGTTVVLAGYAAALGQLGPPPTTAAWAVVVGVAVVPTMFAITLFLAALARIGGSRAALLSTGEPVVTVALAALLLGDRFTLAQAVGALLVLVAVVAVQWPGRGGRETREQLGEPLPRLGEE